MSSAFSPDTQKHLLLPKEPQRPAGLQPETQYPTLNNKLFWGESVQKKPRGILSRNSSHSAVPHSTHRKILGDILWLYSFKKINLLLIYLNAYCNLPFCSQLLLGSSALTGCSFLGLSWCWGARVPFLGCSALSCIHTRAPAMIPQAEWDVKLILEGDAPQPVLQSAGASGFSAQCLGIVLLLLPCFPLSIQASPRLLRERAFTCLLCPSLPSCLFADLSMVSSRHSYINQEESEVETYFASQSLCEGY